MIPRCFMLASAALVSARGLCAQTDSTWRDHARAARMAQAQGAWADARRQLLATDRILDGHPEVALDLARAAAHLGDTAEVFAQLQRIVAMGVVVQGTTDSVFDRLRALPSFRAAVSAIARNGGNVGDAQVAIVLPDSDDIAEDLAWDGARRRFLVSSVRHHKLRAVGMDGRATDFGVPMPPGWAVLAVGADSARGVAWATTVTLPQAEGFSPADSGHAAILRLDLATGAVRRRFDLPGITHAAPGDLVIAGNGDVFIGDGMTGALYVVRAARDVLETLVLAGTLNSTQQPALSPDGLFLFVPQYGRGLVRIDRVSGAVVRVEHGPGMLVFGTDGLILDGRDLIGVQNAVTPNRVVRFTIDAAAPRVVLEEVLLRDTLLVPEPTHVVRVGGYLFVIGNAGWSKYGDDGAPVAGVHWERPRIVRFAVRDRTGPPPIPRD